MTLAPAHAARKRTFLFRAFLRLLWMGPAAFAVLAVLGASALAWHLHFERDELPDLEAFLRFQPATVGRIYDADNHVLFELAREDRQIVTYEGIPPVVRDAIVSAEDKNFFSHPGVDYSVFPRVIWRNLAAAPRGERPGAAPDPGPEPGFSFTQGGSTITQQLVRACFLRSMTSGEEGASLAPRGVVAWLASRVAGAAATNKLARKLEEMRLSLWLEEELGSRLGSRRAAKEEILARYASLVYMGNGRYGFATASEYYFGKPLSSFTVADAGDAAVLAGIMKCPRDYAPAPGNAARVLGRRNGILDRMVSNGSLDDEQARHGRLSPLESAVRPRFRTAAPAVIGTIFSELKECRDERLNFESLSSGRIVVHSTASGGIQAVANDAFERGLARFEERHASARDLIQGAVVVLANEDARILAEIGGRQRYEGTSAAYTDYNRASNALRQPGSAMKPIVYLAAFRQGATLDHEVLDEPITVDGADGEIKWIRNYDGEFKGTIPVRQALAESRNAATVWIAGEAGIRSVLDTARALGIRTPLRPDLSTALGASEMSLVELANAYRCVASGLVARPHAIRSVTDMGGAELFVSEGAPRPVQIDPLALVEIQEGLRGVVRLPRGTAGSLNSSGFPIPVMGKTGTSSGFRDAVFVGSTYGPEGITVAVRLGYDDNRGLGEAETGARVALPIFKEILLEVYRRGLAGPVPAMPPGIETRISEYIACAAPGGAGDPAAAGATLPQGGPGPDPVFANREGVLDARSAPARCASRGRALDRTLPAGVDGLLAEALPAAPPLTGVAIAP